ncbi:MAG: MATE family efflux transporter [Clostridiales bacterium]|nr:MATE family efflux transporter [Clostridiales bacterium]
MLTEILSGSENIPLQKKISVVWNLSIPAILAQLTSILMQYIDAAMVGQLGAGASASIGLVSSSIWLLGGLTNASARGFSVQTAQKIGAGDEARARLILKNSLCASLIFSLVLAAIGMTISGSLPVWLGGGADICADASWYFFIYACSLPVVQLNNLARFMLQSIGNMRLPSILSALMCALDVLFNRILIRRFGVAGAALGTACAQLIIGIVMLWAACAHSPVLRFRRKERFYLDRDILSKAIRLGVPMAFEHVAICGAQVVSVGIVAPLGTVAIAANSFAVTAESICYMPGYGIAAAVAALVGQCVGAKKPRLSRSFANLSVLLGALIMSGAGILMYFLCPLVFSILTPDSQVQALAVRVLRIELLAEPLFAVSIVASGALQGAGDTLIPSLLNLISIWGVRIVLSLLLVGRFGLAGAWIGMAVELCVRGILMYGRMLVTFRVPPDSDTSAR